MLQQVVHVLGDIIIHADEVYVHIAWPVHCEAWRPKPDCHLMCIPSAHWVCEFLYVCALFYIISYNLTWWCKRLVTISLLFCAAHFYLPKHSLKSQSEFVGKFIFAKKKGCCCRPMFVRQNVEPVESFLGLKNSKHGWRAISKKKKKVMMLNVAQYSLREWHL